MYSFLLFDLDGTLTESEQGIVNSVIYALNEMGIKEDDREKLKAFIGPPLEESFMKYYGFDTKGAKKAIEYYRVYYKAKGIFESPLYQGIKETLEALKNMGRKLYVATSKPEVFAKKILEHWEIDGLFEDVVGSNLDGTKVNKDEVISSLLEKNNISDKSMVVMIGDRKHDVLGGKKIGVATVGVLYGYGNLEELQNAGADNIIENISDIISIV